MVLARCFAWGIQKSHLKSLKINCLWVIVHVCLSLGAGRPSLKKVCGTIGKWKFSFSVCSTQFDLSFSQKWGLVFFPLAHNLTSKTGIFFASRRVSTIKSCCFHWRRSKPKPIFLLNQKHQLLKFITILVFHVAIFNLMHRQKIRSYL